MSRPDDKKPLDDINKSRREFTRKAGLTAVPVIVTLSSRPVLATDFSGDFSGDLSGT